jgi:hypothetical protein
VDASFNQGPGPDGPVYTITTQEDGRIMVGGSFSSLAGHRTELCARLNANGSVDSTFVSGLPSVGDVNWVGVRTDGLIVACGSFTTPSAGVALLAPAGGISSVFQGVGAGGATSGTNIVFEGLINPDGSTTMVGEFNQLNGQARSKIARVMASGVVSTWSGGAGFDAPIRSLSQTVTGVIAVGGDFDTYGPNPANKVAHVNGGVGLGMPATELTVNRVWKIRAAQ